MKRIYFLLIACCVLATTRAQTPNDGVMMKKGALCTGFMYMNDQWTKYWEGTLNRDNQNIGTLTTQSFMWYGVYGITDKINVISSVPYVKTSASGGTLHGQEGIQDLTIAGKYRILAQEFGPGKLSLFGVGTFSTPLTNYTADFFPLSLGTSSTNAGLRLTATYRMEQGWFLNFSNGYTWRSNVKLDRPSYFTDNTFYMTDEVQLPSVYDFNVDAGYRKGPWYTAISYLQQNTMGGGDIRRQDMPFVSNQMNFGKLGAMVMYYIPQVKNLAVRGQYTYTVTGRNVGQSSAYLFGVLYTFNFAKSELTQQ